MKKTSLLHPLWQIVFRRAWILNLILFLGLAVMRGCGLNGSVEVRMLVILSFLIMWFLPFLFFTKNGREVAGIRRPDRPLWWLWGILLGIGAAILVFAIGYFLYGNAPDNWFISIRESWGIDASMRELPVGTLFLIYGLPAAVFSPVGEEFFFRGMIHEGAREAWGPRTAAALNALAFAGMHLLHHGISFTGGIHIFWVSGLLWFLLMLGLSGLFTVCRQRSGSIAPAVAAHSAFNLSMTAMIFVFLY